MTRAKKDETADYYGMKHLKPMDVLWAEEGGVELPSRDEAEALRQMLSKIGSAAKTLPFAPPPEPGRCVT